MRLLLILAILAPLVACQSAVAPEAPDALDAPTAADAAAAADPATDATEAESPACMPACQGRECGDDSCGSACGQCGTAQSRDGGMCVESGECGGVSALGTCEGEILQFCLAGELQVYDCAHFGTTCGWDAALGWYDCIDAPCIEGPCDGRPDLCGEAILVGQCEGRFLLYCWSGRYTADDCSAFGKACGWDPVHGRYDCVCVPQCQAKACGDDGCGGDCGACAVGETCTAGLCEAIPCGDVDAVGTCNGSTLLRCVGGKLHTTDCAASGQVCGYDVVYMRPDCVAPP